MLKISRLADYATLLMVYMAKNCHIRHNARDIAKHTHLALPTVSKILKLLVGKDLLISTRGVNGGYSLAQKPSDINMAQILTAIDGEFGMTDCSHISGNCVLEPICSISTNWKLISQTIFHALETLSLADMTKPLTEQNLNFTTHSNIEGAYDGN